MPQRRANMPTEHGGEGINYGKLTWKYFKSFLIILHGVFDCIVDFFFGLYYNESTRKYIPSVDHSFLLESASSIAKKIREGELKSVDVMNACIARIAQVNGTLNAVVDERYKAAVDEAKEADRMIASGEWSRERLEKERPFHGVPFSNKESTMLKGLRHTIGVLARRNETAPDDAEVVKKMRRAGAIPFCLTNVPEFCMWYETRCNVYGQTNNPYDTNRMVGGSSGGESSLLAACGSPFGIGTDVGGSIRMPAFFCGIFGHKPTCGLIDLKGLSRKTGAETETSMVVAGPMSKHAEDLLPAMRVMVQGARLKVDLTTKVEVKKLRVFYIEDDGGDLRLSPVCSDQKNALKKAVQYLGEVTGQPPKKLEIPSWRYGSKIWRYMLTEEPEKIERELTNRTYAVVWWKELLKFIFGTSTLTLPTVMRLVDLQVLPQENAQFAKHHCKLILDELKRELGDDGVLLYPSHPYPALYHYSAHLRPWNFTYTSIFNALKLPTTQVPMGLNAKGLPLGIQVVGNPFNDRLCIAVAEELERGFGGWVPPFKMN